MLDPNVRFKIDELTRLDAEAPTGSASAAIQQLLHQHERQTAHRVDGKCWTFEQTCELWPRQRDGDAAIEANTED